MSSTHVSPLPYPAENLLASKEPSVLDRLRRPLKDLRISVTDRCNFRCVYCMPKEIFGRDYAFLERDELLSFEEIERIARAAVGHGVTKLRLTGGEPLLRRGLEDLIFRLKQITTTEGNPLDIALTTNGSALKVKAQALKDAGLDRVTVSVDSLDDATFRAMNDVNFPLQRVLDGIWKAHEVGIGPIKINMVVEKGRNEDQILPVAEYFKDTPFILRFIEFMDVGETNGWKMNQVVPSGEIITMLDERFGLEKLAPTVLGETAKRYRYRDGSNEIGFISSVTGAFCATCTRARISTEGKLFTCLFASEGHDLRALLRSGATDEELSETLAGIWGLRRDKYSLERDAQGAGPKRNSGQRVEMSYIGG